MTPDRPRPRLRRPQIQLRTRVLAGVLAVTIVALVAFDVAAVKALRGYLLNKTNSQLEEVLSNYRPQPAFVTVFPPQVRYRPPTPRRRPVRSSSAPRLRPSPAPRRAPSAVARLHATTSIAAGHPAAVWSTVFVGPRAHLPVSFGQSTVVEFTSLGQRVLVGSAVTQLAISRRLAQQAARTDAWTVVDRGNVHLLLRAVTEAHATIVATASLSSVNKTVSQLRLILIIGSAAAGLLVAGGVTWIVRRGLRPIETMAVQADRINAGDLTDRVSPQDPGSEIGRLGTALNGMLARIEADVDEREASQDLMRRFFADASHELRNPLASLRANAELYQQGALPERAQVDEAMRRIALEAQRMSGLVDDMLRLARLDQHPARQLGPVDVTRLIGECAERAQITDPQRSWQADVADGLVTVGDEELLRRAVDNLLANVKAHTPAGTDAAVTAAGHGQTITIEVADNGPGVPAGQLPHIFERFYRAGNQSSRPGSGLGLAIVTAIAAAHDGTAEAALGGSRGLCITLTLPSAAGTGGDDAEADDAAPTPLPQHAPRLQLAHGRPR
jgi:two-component system, OmpR family, sensor kinase